MGQDLSSAQLREPDAAAPVPADLAHEDGVPQSKPAADWLQGHLQHLKGLRAPSDQQALLMGPAQNSEFKARYADVPSAEWLRAISLATVEG